MWQTVLYVGGGILLALGVCSFCWMRGGPAERGGVLMILAGWLGVTAVQLLTGQGLPQIAMLLADFLLGLGFLALALKYNNLWVGAAMLLQGVELALNLYSSQETNADRDLRALLVNVISILVLGAIFLGAMASARRRRRYPKAPLPDQAREAPSAPSGY